VKGLAPVILFSCAATFAIAQPPIVGVEESKSVGFLHQGRLTGSTMEGGLAERGVRLFGGYTADVFGKTTGGLKTGTVYAGLLDFGINLDLEKAVGWEGASLSTTWIWLSGRDASEDLAGNFLTISNAAGFSTLQLFELWFQQNVWDDRLSLRTGLLSADSEFVISDSGGLF